MEVVVAGETHDIEVPPLPAATYDQPEYRREWPLLLATQRENAVLLVFADAEIARSRFDAVVKAAS
ncbi:MAG: hypothetical protein KGN77_02045 [Xanthomonadaceae bacterium]|nr:hypothetical protein [Xanthomonadaceae bacterium]